MPRDLASRDDEAAIHRGMASAMLGRSSVVRLSAQSILEAITDEDADDAAMLALYVELQAAAEIAREDGACVVVITHT